MIKIFKIIISCFLIILIYFNPDALTIIYFKNTFENIPITYSHLTNGIIFVFLTNLLVFSTFLILIEIPNFIQKLNLKLFYNEKKLFLKFLKNTIQILCFTNIYLNFIIIPNLIHHTIHIFKQKKYLMEYNFELEIIPNIKLLIILNIILNFLIITQKMITFTFIHLSKNLSTLNKILKIIFYNYTFCTLVFSPPNFYLHAFLIIFYVLNTKIDQKHIYASKI